MLPRLLTDTVVPAVMFEALVVVEVAVAVEVVVAVVVVVVVVVSVVVVGVGVGVGVTLEDATTRFQVLPAAFTNCQVKPPM